jgi:hypothetical protein
VIIVVQSHRHPEQKYASRRCEPIQQFVTAVNNIARNLGLGQLLLLESLRKDKIVYDPMTIKAHITGLSCSMNKHTEQYLATMSVYDRISMLDDVKGHIQNLYNRERAKNDPYIDQGCNGSVKSFEKDGETDPNSIPALNKMGFGLLEKSPLSEIDIFDQLRLYSVQECRHEFVTEIGKYITALKEKFRHKQEDRAGQYTMEQQKHHIAATNSYMQSLKGLLAHNGAQVQLSADDRDGIELTQQLVSCFRQAWQRDYRLALHEYAQEFQILTTRITEAKSIRDRKGIAAGQRAERNLNDRLFHDFVDKYLDGLASQMREQENKSYDELEGLYALYTTGRMLWRSNLHTTYDLVEKIEKLHTETADDFIAQLDALDIQIQACDNMFGIITTDWRKTVTRLHRLTAIDIKDPERRQAEIARRFEHRGAFPLMLQMRMDVAQTTTNLGSINSRLNQIRKGFKRLDNMALDLYVARESAMLAALMGDKTGEVAGLYSRSKEWHSLN